MGLRDIEITVKPHFNWENEKRIAIYAYLFTLFSLFLNVALFHIYHYNDAHKDQLFVYDSTNKYELDDINGIKKIIDSNNYKVKVHTPSFNNTLVEMEPKQHFTQPPAHFTEASLVKTLEELGIGRPSTYSPTITTIIARRYITKENKNLYVTEIGEVVNSIMKESFPTIVDEHFTANMESLFEG